MNVYETLEGVISLHPRGFGFVVATRGDESVSAFVPPPMLNPLLAGDRVRARVATDAQGRLSAVSIERLERTVTEVAGECVRRKGEWFVRVDRLVSNTDWPLDPRGFAVEPGRFVVASLEGDRAIARRLLDSGEDPSLATVIARHGIRSDFPEATVAEVARARATPHALGARRDLRQIPTVTVDAPSTRDIDDAIGVLPAASDGALRLFVSIADASAFVIEGTALDVEARTRATSVYLAGHVLPMLPDALSAEWVSLLPGQDRWCITAELRIDAEGTVTSVDVYESLIRSWARLDYEMFEAYLSHGTVAKEMEPVGDALPWFRAATARLGVTRARRGGMVVSRDEARVTFDLGTGDVSGIVRQHDDAAHRMIERFMVAANEAVAAWLVQRGVPAPFRVHPRPDADRVEHLAAYARNFGVATGFGPSLTPLALAAFDAQIEAMPFEPAMRAVMRRVLGPARYTIEPGLHFGLAADLYLHFTSPIRRYADLAVHRVIKAYLHGARAFDEGRADAARLCDHINQRARAAARAETDRAQMLEARWIGTKQDEVFVARVTRVRPAGLLVQLDDSGIEGMVGFDALEGGPYRADARETSATDGSRTFAIGHAMHVKVASADANLGRVEFAPVSGNS